MVTDFAETVTKTFKKLHATRTQSQPIKVQKEQAKIIKEMVKHPAFVAEVKSRGKVAKDVASTPLAAKNEEEMSFTLTSPDGKETLKVHCRIDQVRMTPEGPVIVELKTSRHWNLFQLYMYSLAYFKVHNVMPYKVEVKSTDSTPQIFPTSQNIEETERIIWEVKKRMETGKFIATPCEDACGRCQFASICPSSLNFPREKW